MKRPLATTAEVAAVDLNHVEQTGQNTPPAPRLLGGWLGPCLGWLCLGHFALQALIKLGQEQPEQILWISHVGLLVAGLGLVLRSRLLIATALIQLFMLHTLWLIDVAVWQSFGIFPLGAVVYLNGADTWTWIGTSYHFYCVPALAIIVWRWRIHERAALLVAVTLSLALIVLSRAIVPPEANVNWAFGIETDKPIHALTLLNDLPGNLYMLALAAFATFLLFIPVFWSLKYRALRLGTQKS